MTTRNNRSLHLADAIMHELKTSLTAIIVSAELLAEELKPEEKSVLDRLIQSVLRNAKSIDGRISMLSEAEGLLADNSKFQPEAVDIVEIIHNTITQLYPEMQSRKLQFSQEVPDSLPRVRADSQYLEQILLTLLANAIKFSDEDGAIKLNASREGTSIQVQVSDNGSGIPENEQDLVFQPYYQVNRRKGQDAGEEDRQHNHLGSDQGIGLAIAKLLVELHGGTIKLESKIGQGSVFTFSLPVAVSIESNSD